MQMTRRDTAATVLVAAAVVPAVGYLVHGDMPFAHSPRDLASIALMLGLAACGFSGGGGRVAVSAVAVLGVAIGLGIAAVVTDDPIVLAGCVGAMVLFWALTIGRRVSQHGPAADTAGAVAR